ncbi:MAG: hypothetical protein U5J99_09770 [Parvularculaceae bacterium]|nr:hypothetical protein [Parvularculaceae bacterium]
MSDRFQAIFETAPWAPLLIALMVGLACGWVIWGLRGASADADDRETSPQTDGDERKEIVVLRAELEAARALLDDSDVQQDDAVRQLASVDEALKRANGRLKVIQRGLKR